eukprot:CAMPEP_0198433384 /NCGR_PEP_ID=MMETSP1452-20131203/26448_1 /TAXON_ID=1181717 /ORGANISM="Synchroma pusillum, Strain CCMP3072" /LENGTH=363 /DNA_ID=CAMNT_0044153877 /DNA_START=36 /DNA_END=1125 /DNA_ORIENTATION=+
MLRFHRMRTTRLAAGAKWLSSATAPENATCLVIGAGHIGTYLATRAQAALPTATVLLKYHPDFPPRAEVRDLCAAHGVRLVDHVPASDLAFITTKTMDHDAACAELADAPHPPRTVTLVHNGLMPPPPKFPEGSDLVRCCTMGSWDFNPDGSFKVHNKEVPWFLPPTEEARPAEAFLNAAGVPAVRDEQFGWRQLKKYLVNTTANLMSIATDKNCGGMLADPDVDLRMERVFREMMAVLRADPTLADAWRWAPGSDDEIRGMVWAALHSYKDHFPSTYADYSAGRPLEHASLNGYVVLAAGRQGVPAPENAALIDEVLAKLEAKRCAVAARLDRAAAREARAKHLHTHAPSQGTPQPHPAGPS